MPGVPSGRGCDACRKQKKKCDQAQPTCSRCTRLKIPCIGGGQQRYKFLDTQPCGAKPPKKIRESQKAIIASTPALFYPPSNAFTMAAGAFCTALNVTDTRYDLSVYGDFMKGIPKRLGSSPALDASVKALTTAFRCGQYQNPSVEAIENYVISLKSLRVCLSDPTEATSPNTLCSMYIMMVLQGWMGSRGDGDKTSHGTAIAHMLSLSAYSAYQDRQDPFVSELLVTLCVPVIFESIGNPKIKLKPWLPRLTEAHDKNVPIESMKLSTLAKLPEFIEAPEKHLMQIHRAYEQLKIDVSHGQEVLERLASKPESRTIYSRYQTVSGMLLTYALIYNSILRSFDLDSPFSSSERELFVDQLIALAEDAMQFRPLGSSAMPLYLTSAWVVATEPAKRSRIEGIIKEYQSDFAIARWMDVAFGLEAMLKHPGTRQENTMMVSKAPMAEMTEPCCPM